jgi:hypothetical protein
MLKMIKLWLTLLLLFVVVAGVACAPDRSEVSKLQSEVQTLKNALFRTQQELISAENELANVRAELTSFKTWTQQELTSTENDLASARAELESLQSRVQEPCPCASTPIIPTAYPWAWGCGYLNWWPSSCSCLCPHKPGFDCRCVAGCNHPCRRISSYVCRYQFSSYCYPFSLSFFQRIFRQSHNNDCDMATPPKHKGEPTNSYTPNLQPEWQKNTPGLADIHIPTLQSESPKNIPAPTNSYTPNLQPEWQKNTPGLADIHIPTLQSESPKNIPAPTNSYTPNLQPEWHKNTPGLNNAQTRTLQSAQVPKSVNRPEMRGSQPSHAFDAVSIDNQWINSDARGHQTSLTSKWAEEVKYKSRAAITEDL